MKRIDPLHDPRVSDITHAIETREQVGDMPPAPVASPPPTRSQQREWERLRDYREQRGLGSGV